MTPDTEDDGFTTVYASRPVSRERRAPHGAFIFPVGAIMVIAAIVLIARLVAT